MPAAITAKTIAISGRRLSAPARSSGASKTRNGTAPGAVDQNTSPVSGRGRDQPGEGEEEEHVRYGDASDSDPDAGENTLEDLICLHDAGPRSSWKPGIVGAFYPDVGGHHALGANGPPARGA